MIIVSVKCSGFGITYYESVKVTSEEIEQLAIDKLRKSDASPTMEAIGTEIILQSGRSH